MDGIEFTLRSANIGITPQWFVKQGKGLIDLKTVVGWQEGTEPLPEDVVFIIETLESRIKSSVDNAKDTINNLIMKNKKPSGISLVRYKTDSDLWSFREDLEGLPVGFHLALLQQTQSAIEKLKVPVKIVCMDPAKYSEWLGEREDSEQLRSEWAASQW